MNVDCPPCYKCKPPPPSGYPVLPNSCGEMGYVIVHDATCGAFPCSAGTGVYGNYYVGYDGGTTTPPSTGSRGGPPIYTAEIIHTSAHGSPWYEWVANCPTAVAAEEAVTQQLDRAIC